MLKIFKPKGTALSPEEQARQLLTQDFQKRLQKNREQAKIIKGILESEKVEFSRRYDNHQACIANLDSYLQSHTLGAGSFGRVILLKEKTSDKHLAMKVMSKKELAKSKHISHIIEEKRILYAINFNLLIRLHSHFQDNSFVYLILEYINGGEMFTHLRKEQKFSESKARFYASQVVLAFEYMHHMDIIYRDLKPENILIHNSGYIKIIDMGFAKRAKGVVWTLCGTPEYIAPEILMNKGYNKSVDWYTLGILMYEMVAGFTPYWAEQTPKIYEKVIEAKLRFPNGFSMDLKDLIKKLLSKDLTYRYGNLKDGVNDIKDHRWFMDTDWMAIFKQEVAAPFLPQVEGPGCSRNFDLLRPEKLIIANEDVFGDAFSQW